MPKPLFQVKRASLFLKAPDGSSTPVYTSSKAEAMESQFKQEANGFQNTHMIDAKESLYTVFMRHPDEMSRLMAFSQAIVKQRKKERQRDLKIQVPRANILV